MVSRRSHALLALFLGMTLVATSAGCRGKGGQQTSGPTDDGGTAPDAWRMNGGGPGASPMSPGAGSSPAPASDAGASATVTPAPAPPVMPPMVVPASGDIPVEVATLLRSRCAGCHTYGLADPAGWGSVLDLSRLIDADIVVPGRPDDSRMIDRVAVLGNMPPKGPRLTADEVALLRGWISNLKRPAPAQLLSDDDILDLIASDQLALRDRSADYRYISFAHQLGEGRPAAELKQSRQVLSFVLNSLSRRGELAELPTIDAEGSIVRLDLADLGWNAQLWDTLTGLYPYCVRSDAASHQALYQQLGTEAPVVRGDWLLATATKAPLYDQLLDLPATVDQLATRLGIDIDDDINHPGQVEPENLVRVGFRKSAVALHNRLVERHLGAAGQYLWLTYDFDSSQGRQDLLSNPLGPANRDQQNFVHTFQHVGGEVIFSLPNGLQGYMVVDAAGRKVAAASNKVLRDPLRRDGVATNGLSCLGCHAGPGILSPRLMDEVPAYMDGHIAEFQGRELVEIEASYPRPLTPDPFKADSARYQLVAGQTPGGAPPSGDSDYPGFVIALGQYEANLGYQGAAAEFGLPTEGLRESVRNNDSQNDSLPASAKQPLVSRDDFVCVWRELVPRIRPNAQFCARTFDAAPVSNSCR